MSLLDKLGKTGKRVAVGTALLTSLVFLSGCPRSANNYLGGLANLYVQTRVARKAWGDNSSDSNSNENKPHIIFSLWDDYNHDGIPQPDENVGLTNGPINTKNIGYVVALVDNNDVLRLKSITELDPNYKVIYRSSDKKTPDLAGITYMAGDDSNYPSGVYTFVLQSKRDGKVVSRSIRLKR